MTALTQGHEVEVKYSVDAGLLVPDLTRLSPVSAAEGPVVHRLSAVYFDTADLRLTRAKITLRRRVGGKDDGWHLKLPSEFGRVEVQAPLNEDPNLNTQPPAQLLDQVRVHTRNHELIPIAQVDNERHEWLLKDDTGTVIGEFVDDHVSGIPLIAGDSPRQWREWEMELAPQLHATEEPSETDEPAADTPPPLSAQELLDEATRLFITAGARVSTSPSKLSQALGAALLVAPLPPQPALDDPSSPAYAVVKALAANRDRLIELDSAVRRDEWDSVHQMRVATRELRSHLQTFEGIVVGPRVTQLEEELKVFAGILGEARDAEVVRDRFEELLGGLPGDIVDSDTHRELTTGMADKYRKAHRYIVGTLNSTKYLLLLDELDDMLANPPLATEDSTAEDTPAAADLPPQAADADDSVTEDAAAGDAAGEDAAGDEAAAVVAVPAPAKKKESTPDEVLLAHLDQTYGRLRKRHKVAMRADRDVTPDTRHARDETFHDVRKAAKKLRYSAEAAGAATGLKTAKLYKATKALQTVLGDFQDTCQSREVLLQRAAEFRAAQMDTFVLGVLYAQEFDLGERALAGYDDAYAAVIESYEKLRSSVKDAKKKKNKKSK